MTNRREVLKHAPAICIVASTSLKMARANDARAEVHPAHVHAKGSRIRAVIRREDTIRRYAGVGDNWHMSWAADDRQYMSLCDGFGFTGQRLYSYNARMFALEGGPQDVRFKDLPNYPRLAFYPSQKLADTRYYPFGTLALDGRLYQYMSTIDRPLNKNYGKPVLDPDPDSAGGKGWVGAKLIYSPDNGKTWCNQDGSAPVVWETWGNRSRGNMVFFEEPQCAFSLISVLQMGRNYEFNRDGYVYLYAPNGNSDGTMNELLLGRVPEKTILDRSTYRFFAGFRGRTARWSNEIGARKPIHTFPRGWAHGYSWVPSVTYNAPLGLFMMASWGWMPESEKRNSYLGLWTSNHPWGPWNQVHEETAWRPGGDENAHAYQPQIAPKWIAPDGKSFWLVWTDTQRTGAAQEYEQMIRPMAHKSFDEYTPQDWELKYQLMRKFNPYYSFNAQRVDLDIRGG